MAKVAKGDCFAGLVDLLNCVFEFPRYVSTIHFTLLFTAIGFCLECVRVAHGEGMVASFRQERLGVADKDMQEQWGHGFNFLVGCEGKRLLHSR